MWNYLDLLPEDLRELYPRIKADLTKIKPSGNECSAQATISNSSDEEASRIAGEIIWFCEGVAWFDAAE